MVVVQTETRTESFHYIFFFCCFLFSIVSRKIVMWILLPRRKEIIPANPNSIACYCCGVTSMRVFVLSRNALVIFSSIFCFLLFGFLFFVHFTPHVLSTIPFFILSIFWPWTLLHCYIIIIHFLFCSRGGGLFLLPDDIYSVQSPSKKFLATLAFSLSLFSYSRFLTLSLIFSLYSFPIYFEFDNFRLKFHFRLNYTQ